MWSSPLASRRCVAAIAALFAAVAIYALPSPAHAWSVTTRGTFVAIHRDRSVDSTGIVNVYACDNVLYEHMAQGTWDDTSGGPDWALAQELFYDSNDVVMEYELGNTRAILIKTPDSDAFLMGGGAVPPQKVMLVTASGRALSYVQDNDGCDVLLTTPWTAAVDSAWNIEASEYDYSGGGGASGPVTLTVDATVPVSVESIDLGEESDGLNFALALAFMGGIAIGGPVVTRWL